MPRLLGCSARLSQTNPLNLRPIGSDVAAARAKEGALALMDKFFLANAPGLKRSRQKKRDVRAGGAGQWIRVMKPE
jgi:hypothetical protein